MKHFILCSVVGLWLNLCSAGLPQTYWPEETGDEPHRGRQLTYSYYSCGTTTRGLYRCINTTDSTDYYSCSSCNSAGYSAFSTYYICRIGCSTDCTPSLNAAVAQWSTTSNITHSHDGKALANETITLGSSYITTGTCPINYQYWSYSSGSQSPQPTYDTGNYVVWDNSTYTVSYSLTIPFHVRAQLYCTNYLQSFYCFDRYIHVQCHSGSTTVSLPAGYSSPHTLNFDIDLTATPGISIPDFSYTQPNCPVSYTLEGEHDSKFPANIQSFTSTYRSAQQVYIDSSLKHTEGNYTFKIVATPEGGATPATLVVTIQVACAASSFQFTTPSFAASQIQQRGGGSEYFEFPEFPTAISGCPVQTYRILDSKGTIENADFTSPSNVMSTLASGNLKAYLSDTTTAQTYTFKIEVIAKGGGSQQYGTYTIELKCLTANINIQPGSGFQTTLTYLPQAAAITYTFPAFDSGHAYCSITSYAVSLATGSGVSLVSSGCSTSPCRDITIDASALIVYTVSIQVTTEDSSTSTTSMTVHVQCGGESLSLSQTELLYNYSKSIDPAAPTHTELFSNQLNGFFSTDNSICVVYGYELYSDSLLSTLVQTTDAVTLNRGTTPSLAELITNLTAPLFQTVYLKVITQGSVSSTFQVKTLVCGFETLVNTTNATQEFQFLKQVADNNTSVLNSTLAALFNYTAGNQSSSWCENATLGLYTDATLQTQFVNDNRIELLTENSTQRLHIWVNNSYAPLTLYLGMFTKGNVNASVQFLFEVCGTEMITLNHSDAQISRSFKEGTGDASKQFHIELSEYSGFFQSNSTKCQPIEWQLYADKDGSANSTSTNVFMDSTTFKISISTKVAYSKTFYVAPVNHHSTEFLPLHVVIIPKPVPIVSNVSMNFQPLFEENPPSLLTYSVKQEDQENDIHPVFYFFSSVAADIEGDPFVMDITGGDSDFFDVIKHDNNTFQINVKTADVTKTHTEAFSIILKDGKSTLEPVPVDFEIQIEYIEKEEPEPEPEPAPPIVVVPKVEKYVPPRKKAKKVFGYSARTENNGDINIEYNQAVIVDDEVKQALLAGRRLQSGLRIEDFVQITVKQDDSSPEGVKLDADIKLKDITLEGLKFSSDFQNPLDVSIGEKRDKFEISLLMEEFQKHFTTLNGEGINIGDDTEIVADFVDVYIPKQLPSDPVLLEKIEQQKEAADTLNSALMYQFVLTYLMKAAMSQVWSAANILQVITHYPLVDLNMAADSIDLFQQINQIVTFELIPEEITQPIQESIYVLPSDVPYTQSFSDIDYETGYFLVLLFSQIVLVSLCIINFLVSYLLYKACPRGKMKKLFKARYKEYLPFFQRLFIELSMELSVISLVEIIMRQTATTLERVSYFCSVANLTLVILVPVWVQFVMSYNFYKIHNPAYPEFNATWGVFWEDLKLIYESTPNFYLAFVLRRFVYSLLLVVPAQFNLHVVFQMAFIIWLNLWMTCYIISKRPYQARHLNNIEIFNEWINLVVSTLLFTQIQLSQGDQIFLQSQIINFTILGMFLINVIFVLYYLLLSKFTEYKQWWQQRQAKKKLLKINFHVEKQKEEVVTPVADLKPQPQTPKQSSEGTSELSSIVEEPEESSSSSRSSSSSSKSSIKHEQSGRSLVQQPPQSQSSSSHSLTSQSSKRRVTENSSSSFEDSSKPSERKSEEGYKPAQMQSPQKPPPEIEKPKLSKKATMLQRKITQLQQAVQLQRRNTTLQQQRLKFSQQAKPTWKMSASTQSPGLKRQETNPFLNQASGPARLTLKKSHTQANSRAQSTIMKPSVFKALQIKKPLITRNQSMAIVPPQQLDSGSMNLMRTIEEESNDSGEKGPVIKRNE